MSNCKRKNKLHVFDLDHTLIRGNCSFSFGIFLFQNKVLSLKNMLRLVFFYVLFKIHFISLKKLHEATFKYFFFSLSVKLIDAHAELFLKQKLNHIIYQPAYSQLQQAKDDGHYTVILSSSPHFLVEKVATIFGVDSWDSTIYQKNGKDQFSHISQFMLGEEKALSIQHFLQDLKITKEDVTAYTDSYLDLPLLKAAGTPVAVNPDYRLKRHCRKNLWTII